MFENVEFKTLNKIAIFILALYLSPLLILGQAGHFGIHDALAGKHDTLKVLSDSGEIFGDHNTTIPAMLNGVPRSSMGSEYDSMLWLMYFLGPFPALVVAKIIIHSVAFFGMHRLLVNHFLGKEMKTLSLGVALAFSVLPHYAHFGLSVAAQPLVLDSFMTIRRSGGRWTSWLVLVLVPFFSALYYSFLYILIFMGLVLGYDAFRSNKFNWKFLGAIVSMSMVFLLVEYRNIFMMLFNVDFISVREEFSVGASQNHSISYSIYRAIKSILHGFVYSQHDVNLSLQTFVIIPSAVIGLFIVFDRKIREPRFLLALFFIILSCTVYAVVRSDLMLPLKELFVGLRKFNIYLIFMEPMLWFLVFALSLKLMVKNAKRGATIALFLVSLQILYGFFNHSEIQKSRKPSYEEFFSVALFKEIENFIGRPKSEYRVVSIGLHPGISLYNGFYTLDGYFTNFSLAHKKAFRKIIAPELEKNEQIRRDYDAWGARCYVFVEELEYGNWLYTKHKNQVVHQLGLNMDAFLELGGEYVFSAVEVKNHKENQMVLLKTFEDSVSAWKIFLYRVEIKSIKS